MKYIHFKLNKFKMNKIPISNVHLYFYRRY